MPIYTQRGLKIRIAVPYAFGLMARLHPKVTPFRVLKTTEGIERLPGMLAFIAGMIAFFLRISPIQIALVVAAGEFTGMLINACGIYILPGLVGLGTLYSYISGYGIYLIAVTIAGSVLGGWQSVAAFFVGKVISYIIWLVVESWRVRRSEKLTGHPFTGSEMSFFNAYRLHASRTGTSTDICLTDEELEEDRWRTTFERFAMEWPEVVQRFTND